MASQPPQQERLHPRRSSPPATAAVPTLVFRKVIALGGGIAPGFGGPGSGAGSFPPGSGTPGPGGPGGGLGGFPGGPGGAGTPPQPGTGGPPQ